MYIRKKDIPINKLIKKAIKYACNELKLPEIKYKYNNKSNICFCARGNKYHLNTYLLLDYVTMIIYCKIKNNTEIFQLNKLNSIEKRIKFIVYHEIGHYLQFMKYRSWHFKYVMKKSILLNLSESEYRNLKIEKTADKIAYALIKREYKLHNPSA